MFRRAVVSSLLLMTCACTIEQTVRQPPPGGASASTLVLLTRGDEVACRFTDDSTGTYDLVVGDRLDRIRDSPAPVRRHASAASWPGELAIPRRFLRRDSHTGTVMLGSRRAFLRRCRSGRIACQLRGPRNLREWRSHRWLTRFGSGGPLRATSPNQCRASLNALDCDHAIHFAPYRRRWRMDPSWCDGRVVLIGDAAHATSPNMAQGASMALEDALVLARMLRAPRSAKHEALSRVQRAAACSQVPLGATADAQQRSRENAARSPSRESAPR